MVVVLIYKIWCDYYPTTVLKLPLHIFSVNPHTNTFGRKCVCKYYAVRSHCDFVLEAAVFFVS